MKTIPISVLLLALAATTTSGLALTADQKISAVTVYPDRALVTRSGTVTLAAGVQAVTFENLPIGLEEDSVRAKAQGKLKILGVEVKRDYKEVAVSGDAKQLQDDALKIEDNIRTLNDEAADLQKRSDFLDQIRNKVTTQTAPNNGDGTKAQPDTVQNIQGLYQLYGDEMSKITNRKRDIDFALRDLNKQHDDLENKLDLMQQPSEPNTRSAIVTVEAADAGPASLEVSYAIPGASWEPQYDAYADPDTQTVELTNYGVVRQTTGEDWTDVALTLSSAQPSSAARLPELSAWTIDIGSVIDNQVNVAKAASQSAQNSVGFNGNGLIANNDASNLNTSVGIAATGATLGPVPDAGVQIAEVHSLGPAATFVVPTNTTIPSDNQPHRSAISVQSLKGEWTYESTPKLVKSAFLKSRVTNTSGGPLLPGQINSFLGGNFIGKSYIRLVAANASFDLYLGTDENIKVTRTEGVKKEETGGIISRTKVYKRSYTIEIENFKAIETAFKVHDQVPVSRNDQITVTVNKVDPGFTSQDKDTGEVTWEFKLKPNEKKSITVEYQIETPFDQVVAGL